MAGTQQAGALGSLSAVLSVAVSARERAEVRAQAFRGARHPQATGPVRRGATYAMSGGGGGRKSSTPGDRGVPGSYA